MSDAEKESGTGVLRSNGQSKEDDEPGRMWRSLKALLFGNTEDNSLRAQIEEVIDDHESDAESDPNGREDVSSLELEMLRNMLHFSENRVDDIAVPRADMIAIDVNAPFSDFVDIFSEHGHSRIPVYRENLDNIIGMIHIKDIFAIVAKGDKYPDDITPFLRQPRFPSWRPSSVLLLSAALLSVGRPRPVEGSDLEGAVSSARPPLPAQPHSRLDLRT